MTPDPKSLLASWLEIRATRTRPRARDIAAELGLSEAQLVASACGAAGSLGATRLEGDWADLLRRLPALGTFKTITRNEYAVIEVEGPYDQVSFEGKVGLSLGKLDMRIFLFDWTFGFVLDEETPRGPRRSLQFFNGAGIAIHKVYAVAGTDTAGLERLIGDFRAADQSPALAVRPPRPAATVRPDDAINVAGLRAAWASLQDTHDFFDLLKRFEVDRLQAMRLVGEPFVFASDTESLKRVLETSAGTGIPFMVFVGNPGMLQIHTGAVERVVEIPGWINVLDPTFNLHVRSDAIAHAYVVRKPSRDGTVTALELYAADGTLIAQLFGKRKPGIPESPQWREMLEAATRVPAVTA
jgi:putative hemin transport protein